MGLLKGRSAYLIFRKHPNFRKRYPKGHFWSPGKFCRSMSGVDSYTVDNYIENQQFDKLQESIELAKEEARQLSLTCFL
jgi:REP element-mobilizing transposase RayT